MTAADNLFADLTLEVSDFVALVNQTLTYAYPAVTIRGEVANFKISKNKWVYFDLKDEAASVRFFGTVYQLSGPLEDGMLLTVRGAPRLHARYGFSVSVLSMRPEGEGSIRRAADLLAATLEAEGLFAPGRKRALPYPPVTVGLVASTESAAYADFLKVLNARWGGLQITCIDVQVQGEAAPAQIVAAIEAFNRSAVPPDVLVLTRGGGSAEDLYAFSTEQVTRAVAASRVPTLVAIGHEVDISLAELAADQRASTPSNAAELLVPQRQEALRRLRAMAVQLDDAVERHIRTGQHTLAVYAAECMHQYRTALVRARSRLTAAREVLAALDPHMILRRGYAIVRTADGRLLRHAHTAVPGGIVQVVMQDGGFEAIVRTGGK